MLQVSLKRNIALIIIIGLLSGLSFAEDLNLDDEFSLDDDLLFSDDLVFEEDEQDQQKVQWWNELFALSLEESAGWSSNQDALYINQTKAGIQWSDSLSAELFAEFDLSAWMNWNRTDLMSGLSLKQELEYSFNTVYLQSSLGDFSAKAGKYAIGWGQLEGAGILDIINPSPDPTKGELGGLGSGQWFLSGEYYSNKLDASVFYNLDPELSSGMEIDGVSEELGLKIGKSITGSDLDVYLAQLYEELPDNLYQVAGISVNRAMGNWLLKSDIAYKQGLTLYSGGPENSNTYNRFDYGLGFEFNSPDGKQLTAAAFGRSWQGLDDSYGNLMPLPTEPPSYFIVPAINPEVSALVMFTDNFLNDDLSLTLMATGALNGDLLMMSSQLGYQFNDNWNSSMQYTLAQAESSSIYAAFDGEQLFLLSVGWNN